MKRWVLATATVIGLSACARPHTAVVASPHVSPPGPSSATTRAVPGPTEAAPSALTPPDVAEDAAQHVAVSVLHTDTWPDAMAAYGGKLYTFTIDPGARPERVTLTEMDSAGHSRSAVIREGNIAEFYRSLSVGPTGIYLSTSVISKFSSLPDEALRVDPATLHVTVRREWDRSNIVALGNAVYALSASTIQRLEPLTLRPAATHLRASPLNPPLGGIGYWDLALGGGKLWATYGDAVHSDLTTFDPLTLAPLRGTWPVPPGQGLRIVATPTGAWLSGQGFVVRASRPGQLAAQIPVQEHLNGAVASGETLLAVGDADRPLLTIHADGSTQHLAFTDKECGQLVSDGSRAWLRCGDHDLVTLLTP